MVQWLKLAGPGSNDLGSKPDPNQALATQSPIPSVSIQNKPAPGHKGPRGMAPKTEYTRVNTGTPPTPDAGSEAQKSVAPRGMEFLPGRAKTAAFQEKDSMTTSMMKRPQLQDLVKEAMEGAARKVDINIEAARQLANLGEQGQEKTAAPQLDITPSEYIEKLAGALDYLAKQAAEDSSGVGPGAGPGALEASAATSSGQVLEAGKGGQGIPKNVPPKSPPDASSGVAKDAPTGLQTNMEQSHADYPVDPMHNEKTSAVLLQKNMERLGLSKQAAGIGAGGGLAGGALGGSATRTLQSPVALVHAIKAQKAAEQGKEASALLTRNLARLGLAKHAEDDGEGGSPNISAGAAPAQGAVAPPGASPSGEQVPSEPSDVNAQKALISSNEAAINYTKGQAKADPKRDSNHVWDEPALSAAHDSILQQAFDATGKAGVKISHDLTRVAAAQALLRKHAEGAKEKKDGEKGKEKKEKEGAMPGLSTPAGQSGFTASNPGM